MQMASYPEGGGYAQAPDGETTTAAKAAPPTIAFGSLPPHAGDPAELGRLRFLMRSKLWRVRRDTVRRLTEHGSVAGELLCEALEDSQAQVRESAILGLAKTAVPQAVPALIRRMRTDTQVALTAKDVAVAVALLALWPGSVLLLGAGTERRSLVAAVGPAFLCAAGTLTLHLRRHALIRAARCADALATVARHAPTRELRRALASLWDLNAQLLGCSRRRVSQATSEIEVLFESTGVFGRPADGAGAPPEESLPHPASGEDGHRVPAPCGAGAHGENAESLAHRPLSELLTDLCRVEWKRSEAARHELHRRADPAMLPAVHALLGDTLRSVPRPLDKVLRVAFDPGLGGLLCAYGVVYLGLIGFGLACAWSVIAWLYRARASDQESLVALLLDVLEQLPPGERAAAWAQLPALQRHSRPGITRVLNREAVRRLDLATRGLRDLPIPGSPPAPDAATLPRVAGGPPTSPIRPAGTLQE